LDLGTEGVLRGERRVIINWCFLSLHVVHPPISALERVIVLRTYTMEGVTLSM